MRRWIGAISTAAAALAVAGVLGVADAQEQAPPPAAAPRLMTVNGGSASEVSSDAAAADRRTAYRTALSGAIDDAAEKAALLAGRTGLTVGAVQSVTEQTGSVLDGCVTFAVSPSGAEARPLAPVRRPQRPRRPRAGARGAQAPDSPPAGPYRCQVVANVAVTYALAG